MIKFLRWLVIRPLMIIWLFVCMFAYLPYTWATNGRSIFYSGFYVNVMEWGQNAINHGFKKKKNNGK